MVIVGVNLVITVDFLNTLNMVYVSDRVGDAAIINRLVNNALYQSISDRILLYVIFIKTDKSPKIQIT
jgi:hypothetical protein